MRALALTVLTALLTTSVLAGCLSEADAPVREPTCEEKHDIPEGHGYVIIYMDQPKNLRRAGFISLWAQPGLVAWKAATEDNQTRDFVGASIGERVDWTAKTQLWYSEAVPSGNYTYIRIQVEDPITAQRYDGERPDIGVRGEHLTYRMADARYPWHIPEGECTHMAFTAQIVTPGVAHDFEIEAALRDPPPQ